MWGKFHLGLSHKMDRGELSKARKKHTSVHKMNGKSPNKRTDVCEHELTKGVFNNKRR